MYSGRFARDLKDLPQRDRVAVVQAVKDLPAGDVLKLRGTSDRWRLRVGKWRVFLIFNNAEGTIEALSVVRRSDTTY